MKNATKGKQAPTKKPAVKIIPELKEEKPAYLEGKFKIKSLLWKEGQAAWSLLIEIKKDFDETFINYTARIAFDPSRFLDRIKDVKDEIADIEDDNTLFPKLQKEKVKRCEEEIDNIKAEMAETQEKCQTIEFPATAIKIDMTGADPKVTFAIPAGVVEQINKIRFDQPLYKLMLDKVAVKGSLTL